MVVFIKFFKLLSLAIVVLYFIFLVVILTVENKCITEMQNAPLYERGFCPWPFYKYFATPIALGALILLFVSLFIENRLKNKSEL